MHPASSWITTLEFSIGVYNNWRIIGLVIFVEQNATAHVYKAGGILSTPAGSSYVKPIPPHSIQELVGVAGQAFLPLPKSKNILLHSKGQNWVLIPLHAKTRWKTEILRLLHLNSAFEYSVAWLLELIKPTSLHKGRLIWVSLTYKHISQR